MWYTSMKKNIFCFNYWWQIRWYNNQSVNVGAWSAISVISAKTWQYWAHSYVNFTVARCAIELLIILPSLQEGTLKNQGKKYSYYFFFIANCQYMQWIYIIIYTPLFIFHDFFSKFQRSSLYLKTRRYFSCNLHDTRKLSVQ